MQVRELPIIIRDSEEADIPYVFNSWKKSYQLEGVNRHMRPHAYWELMNERCDKIIKGGATLTIAAADFDKDFIVGWILFDEEVMHYAFTKGPYRNMGVFRRLRNHTGLPVPTMCTHWTKWLEGKARDHNLFDFTPSHLRKY